MPQPARFRINTPSVVNETIDGEAVIINLRAGFYYSLLGVGAEIWDAIGRQTPVSHIVQDLTARYTGAPEEITASAHQLIDELLHEALIVPIQVADGSGSAASAASRTAGSAPFIKPTLNKYGDLQDLLLLDPIHQVDEQGWPRMREDAAPTAWRLSSAWSAIPPRGPINRMPQVQELLHETKPAEFFRCVLDSFHAASRACEVCERHYRIAGYVVRLRFAGSALVGPMTRALEHLASAPVEPPSLPVWVWDSASTSVPMPQRPWATDDFLRGGEIRGYNDERFFTMYQHVEYAVNLLDLAQNLGVWWIPDATKISPHAISMPLRGILQWWMSRHRRPLLHAAAVGTHHGGVLIVGGPGAGKSTTALACLNSRLTMAGDDQVAISCDLDPLVHSVYNSLKVAPHILQQFPALERYRAHTDIGSNHKALLFLHPDAPSHLRTQFPLKAILVPTPMESPSTTLTRISPATALKALAPGTMFLEPRVPSDALRLMRHLVTRLPTFALRLGRDLSQIPKVIPPFLET